MPSKKNANRSQLRSTLSPKRKSISVRSKTMPSIVPSRISVSAIRCFGMPRCVSAKHFVRWRSLVRWIASARLSLRIALPFVMAGLKILIKLSSNTINVEANRVRMVLYPKEVLDKVLKAWRKTCATMVRTISTSCLCRTYVVQKKRVVSLIRMHPYSPPTGIWSSLMKRTKVRRLN